MSLRHQLNQVSKTHGDSDMQEALKKHADGLGLYIFPKDYHDLRQYRKRNDHKLEPLATKHIWKDK